MAAMLLPGMKVLPLLIQRKIARTIELQESIGKGQFGKVCTFSSTKMALWTHCSLSIFSSSGKENMESLVFVVPNSSF
ncbi:hypothetical protein STEG23_013687, partial [Scotinomys teguina]